MRHGTSRLLCIIDYKPGLKDKLLDLATYQICDLMGQAQTDALS